MIPFVCNTQATSGFTTKWESPISSGKQLDHRQFRMNIREIYVRILMNQFGSERMASVAIMDIA